MLGTGDRVTGHEIREVGAQVCRRSLDHHLLDAADIGNNGIGTQCRHDRFEHARRCTQRRCHHDHVGTVDGSGSITGIFIDDAERERLLEVGHAAADADDVLDGAGLAQGARERTADQPYADNGQALDHRAGGLSPAVTALPAGSYRGS